MKLPHISIEYRDEETFAPDRVSLSLVLGFGLFWAWIWLVLYNGPELFYPRNPGLFQPVLVATICICAITLLCYGIFLKQFRALFSTRQKRKRNRTFGTLALVVGTALLLLLNNENPPVGIVGTSALLNGIGSAVLLMSFGVSTSVLDIAEAVSATSGAVFVGTVFFAGIMLLAQQSPVMGIGLILVLPIGEFICLWHCSKSLVDRMEFSTSTLSVQTAPFMLHVCAPMLVLGAVLGFVRPLTLVEAHANHAFATVALPYILASIMVAALAFAAMILQRQSNNFMFRTLFPVGAFLLLAVCTLGTNNAELDVFLLFSTYLMIEASCWVMLSDISQRFRISAFTAFGFGQGALAVGVLVGYFAAITFGAGQSFLDNITNLSVTALALMILGQSLLPKNAELRNTLKLGKNCPALRGDEQFARVSNQELEFTAPRDNVQEDGVKAQEIPDESPESGAHAERIETLDAIQEQLDAAEERDKGRQGRFKRKCAAVADTYLLSRKETEVLFLLAKGRNAAAIQEQLYISAGTANTHMRHIYRKLNVHSQQELIALVEETEVDDLTWEN